MQDDELTTGSPPALERRLATILVADVFGYSRMMRENEERTIKTFQGHREIFEGLLKQHHGRIFNTAGDAILAEFPSAVESVRCATEIQTALRTRNEHLPPEQRILFRIGINLGDVIVQGNDLLGDGVNVAARIQTVAEPGGICLSGSVYDQIRNKLSLQFKQLGERSFKNIAEPIRTFSITDTGDGVLPSTRTRRQSIKKLLVAVGVSAIALAAVASAYWVYRAHGTQQIDESRISAEKEAQRAAADQERMAAEAQHKAEVERTAKEATEREEKLRNELLNAQRKVEQERMTREAVQREAKLQVEQERMAREAEQREAKMQAERERIAREAAEREARLQLEQERITREAAEREAKLQAELKAAQTKLLQEEAKKQAAQQASAAAGVSPKTATPTGSDPNRYDGTYRGQLCTRGIDGSSAPICRPTKINIKETKIFGSWFAESSGKRAHLKGTIAPEGSVKIAIDAFDRRGKPMSCTMTGTWSDGTLTASGAWHPRDIPVKAEWTREP